MTQTDPNQPPQGQEIPPPAGAPPVSYATATDAYVGPPPDKDSMTMAMLCHLLAIFTGFVGPLVIWLLKKDSSLFVDDQGKEALNFQLTILIGYVIAGATSCIFIGLVLFPVIWVLSLILCIMGTVAANKGEAYRYPFALRLIK